MCGRYTLTLPDYESVAEALGVAPDAALAEMYRPRFNFPPMDTGFVLRVKEGERQTMPARWGLVPIWAKDEKAAARHINARAETVRTKPSFRDAFAKRRCVIPADGFYEWVGEKGRGKVRTPIWFHAPPGQLLHFAGLYERWKNQKTEVWTRTFTIITVEANATVSPAHDRMPAILWPDEVDTWLGGGRDADVLHGLLRPAEESVLLAAPASTRVNSVKNDDPDCLVPDPSPDNAGQTLDLFAHWPHGKDAKD